MNIARLEVYRGTPIIDNVPEFTVLKADRLGEEIIKKVNSQYKGTPAELVSNPDRNTPFRESNPFNLFAVDSAARDLGWRVMLPEEAQLLLDLDKMPERDSTYKDLGLTMDFSGKNHELALDIYNRLAQEERDLDRFPAVFTGLVPIRSDFGGYGLLFETTPYAQMRTAKVLTSSKGNFDNDDVELLRSGLPSKLGDGNRRLYTLHQNKPCLDNLGVGWLYLGGDSDLGSVGGGLVDSDEGGRVVLVSGEATSQKISQYLINLHRQRRDLEAQLQKVKEAEELIRKK